MGVLSALLALAAAASVQEPANDSRSLCDGATLAGWWGSNLDTLEGWSGLPEDRRAAQRESGVDALGGAWKVEQGELVGASSRVLLTTFEELGDFELLGSYMLAKAGMASLVLRGTADVTFWDPQITTPAGFAWGELNDGGGIYPGFQGSGGLDTNAPFAPGYRPSASADRKAGEWNELRVRLVGERLSVWINGLLVQDLVRVENGADREQPLARSGPLAFASWRGPLRLRDLRVRAIEAPEASAILSASTEGFEPLFGWTGDRDAWEEDGRILRAREGGSGVMHTTEELSDFSAAFELRLPPGGRAGMALRYAGAGGPAETAACEIALADESFEGHAGLDPLHSHGAAHGLAAARGGYLRAAGEWNAMELHLQGHHLVEEVNGVRVLELDLERVQVSPPDSACHPGLLNGSGSLALVSYGDPVEVRGLRVRRHAEPWPSLEPFLASRFWAVVAAYGGFAPDGRGSAAGFTQTQGLIQVFTDAADAGAAAADIEEPAREGDAVPGSWWQGVPVVMYALGPLWEESTWNASDSELAVACAEFMARNPEVPPLELSGADPDSSHAALRRLAEWFRQASADPENLSAMIFCQDDGPYRPRRRAQRTPVKALETQTFADGAELRILPEGTGTHWRTLELERPGRTPYRFDLTELPSPPTFERAPPPLRLGPYGWRLHLRFGTTGDMELAYLYVDRELSPLFYHLTW